MKSNEGAEVPADDVGTIEAVNPASCDHIEVEPIGEQRDWVESANDYSVRTINRCLMCGTSLLEGEDA